MTVNECILQTEKLVDRALHSSTSHLLSMTGYLALSKGKGIRAQVLISSSMTEGGEVPPKAANLAAAVEMLHLATLIHDDVIDDAATRRGAETLHAKFGNRKAVICGDYLICLALEMLSDFAYEDLSKYADLFPRAARALRRVCEGECRELIENRNVGLSFFDYLKIISGKTAGLFFLSARLGAYLSEAGDEETGALARFGKNMGMLFQIADDLKDYELSEEQAKKPVNNDIAQGVVTLPLIFALRRNKDLRYLAAEVMNGGKPPADLIKEVIDSGAIGDSKDVAARYRMRAEKSLMNLKNTEKRDSLLKILYKC